MVLYGRDMSKIYEPAFNSSLTEGEQARVPSVYSSLGVVIEFPDLRDHQWLFRLPSDYRFFFTDYRFGRLQHQSRPVGPSLCNGHCEPPKPSSVLDGLRTVHNEQGQNS